MCRKPARGKLGSSFPCGQCIPCRINRRRVWTHRLILESKMHKENCFVTLTYNPEFCPKDGSLVPDHLTAWLKKLRKCVAPSVVRFYGVGEYGDVSFRPHYHVLLFGLGPCRLYGSWGMNQRSKTLCPCWICQTVSIAWGHRGKSFGRVSVDKCEPDSMGYVAGYVVKKMTSKEDKRLGGKHPEFCRMSRMPGIGAKYIDEFVDKVLTVDFGIEAVVNRGDVPDTLYHGKKKMPLGRYLMRRMRKEYGGDGNEPKSSKRIKDEKALPRVQGFDSLLEIRREKQCEDERSTQRCVQVEAKQKINNRRPL